MWMLILRTCLQEKVLQRLNKHHNQQALTSSIEEGLKLQAINRAQRVVSYVNFVNYDSYTVQVALSYSTLKLKV